MGKLWSAALAKSADSATHLWANIVIVLSAIAAVAIDYAKEAAGLLAWLFDDPNMVAQVQSLIPQSYVPFLLIGIMVITKFARNRTIGRPAEGAQ